MVLKWGLPSSEHTDRGPRVRGALGHGVGLAVARLGMNLADGRCLTRDEPERARK